MFSKNMKMSFDIHSLKPSHNTLDLKLHVKWNLLGIHTCGCLVALASLKAFLWERLSDNIDNNVISLSRSLIYKLSNFKKEI